MQPAQAGCAQGEAQDPGEHGALLGLHRGDLERCRGFRGHHVPAEAGCQAALCQRRGGVDRWAGGRAEHPRGRGAGGPRGALGGAGETGQAGVGQRLEGAVAHARRQHLVVAVRHPDAAQLRPGQNGVESLHVDLAEQDHPGRRCLALDGPDLGVGGDRRDPARGVDGGDPATAGHVDEGAQRCVAHPQRDVARAIEEIQRAVLLVVVEGVLQHLGLGGPAPARQTCCRVAQVGVRLVEGLPDPVRRDLGARLLVREDRSRNRGRGVRPVQQEDHRHRPAGHHQHADHGQRPVARSAPGRELLRAALAEQLPAQ